MFRRHGRRGGKGLDTMTKHWIAGGVGILAGGLVTVPVYAAGLNVNLTSTPSSLSVLVLLTGITLLPFAVMTLTAFPRIIVVLSLMRNALGLQTTPPTAILVGLSLILTVFVMEPTMHVIYVKAVLPYQASHLTLVQALTRAKNPLETYMLGQTRPTDLAFFFRLAHVHPPARASLTPFWIAMPAFLVSQLTIAFEMGVFLYLPFLVIDLVVSTVLMSMGMIMVPPTLISLPMKLLLFVLADGWVLLVQSLVTSFH